MDELKYATDLQELLEIVKDGAPVDPSEAYDLIERIDREMEENAALFAEHLVVRRAFHNVEGTINSLSVAKILTATRSLL
jgi:hypothetical protein